MVTTTMDTDYALSFPEEEVPEVPADVVFGRAVAAAAAEEAEMTSAGAVEIADQVLLDAQTTEFLLQVGTVVCFCSTFNFER